MTADTVGGVWTYALELAQGLGRRGNEVLLATMGASLTRQQFEEAGALENVHLFESSYKLEWMDDPWVDLAAAGEWLLELERQFQPDLIHLNGYAHGALPWHAPVVVVGHSCVVSWWKAVRGGDAPAEWNDYRQLVRAGLRSAAAVIAPSATMLAALQEHYGPFANTRVIPNGRTFPTAGHGEKKNLIVAAGRVWDEAKNISALIEIAPELAWPVCVAGATRNPGRGSTDACAGNPADGKKVNFLGCIASAELWKWLGRASIFALPACYEPFGLTPLEAALSGCALVLGDIPSLREIWGKAAVFVDPRDTSALKAALEELFARPQYLREKAAAAHALARSYTPGRMAEGYLSVYHEILGAASNRETRPEPGVLQPVPEWVVCES